MFKKCKKILGGIGVATASGVAVVVSAGQALAVGALDLTGVSLDTTTAGDAALIVIAGLAILWGIKKGISFFR